MVCAPFILIVRILFPIKGKTETAEILNFADRGSAGEAEHGPTVKIPKNVRKVAKTAEKRESHDNFPIKNRLIIG